MYNRSGNSNQKSSSGGEISAGNSTACKVAVGTGIGLGLAGAADAGWAWYNDKYNNKTDGNKEGKWWEKSYSARAWDWIKTKSTSSGTEKGTPLKAEGDEKSYSARVWNWIKKPF